MRTTYICFNLQSLPGSVSNTKLLNDDYECVYKPLGQFLYSHSDFPFTFSFNGEHLSYLHRKNPSFTTLLKGLISKKQLDFLSEGYYSPLLPILFPADRNGHLDLMDLEMRQSIGVKSCGIDLQHSIWDASLLSSISTTCGQNGYIFLDGSMVPDNKRIFLPLIMTHISKAQTICPCYYELNPNPEETPEDFINKILTKIESVDRHSAQYASAAENVVYISLNHDEMYHLNQKNWFKQLYEYLRIQDDIKITRPSLIHAKNPTKCPVYIPSGLSDCISKYVSSPYTITTHKHKKNYNIFDYMETYDFSYSLYCKMMNVSVHVNTYKEDKQRKIAARTELWKAQAGYNYIWSPIDVASNFRNRQKAYQILMNVDKILHEESKANEVLMDCDYHNIGTKEYVCRMDSYFAYISRLGGAVRELELFNGKGNYVDNLTRLQQFDGYEDHYKRGLFLDHIFTDKQFSNYIKNEENSDGLFANIFYQQLLCVKNKKEIHLCARAVLKNTPIYIKKSYRISSNGMFVRYIIRNEGEKKLKAKFAVESNFACLNYISSDINYYKLDIVANNDVYYFNDDKKLVSGNKNNINNKLESEEIETSTNYDNLVNDVTSLRVTDIENKIAFSYEPNEKCGFCFNTIEFLRPNFKGELIKAQKTFVSSLFWNLEIEPGFETEKNISFTISQVKNLKDSL